MTQHRWMRDDEYKRRPASFDLISQEEMVRRIEAVRREEDRKRARRKGLMGKRLRRYLWDAAS